MLQSIVPNPLQPVIKLSFKLLACVIEFYNLFLIFAGNGIKRAAADYFGVEGPMNFREILLEIFTINFFLNRVERFLITTSEA